MTFANRIADATAHERTVELQLAAHTWNVCPFGQGQLSDDVRAALRVIDTPIRWLPDLIAVRGDVAYLIDAKWSTRHDTGFHDIEWSSLIALDTLARAIRIPVALVWFDLTVSFTWELLADGAPLRRGRYNGHGSGTPFRLWPKDQTRPFGDVFAIDADAMGAGHWAMNHLRDQASRR